MSVTCPYGTHRVLEPVGVLPQAAHRLDNTMKPFDNELLIDVLALKLDSASFVQMARQADYKEENMRKLIFDTVRTRGKMHNPVTNSGGNLLGEVIEIGASHPGIDRIAAGQYIVSLVSLTLTPLTIADIYSISFETRQVEVEGKAILFESARFVEVPRDFPDSVFLSIVDVAGAPAQVRLLSRAGDIVAVLGAGGKAGLLALSEARRSVGEKGFVIAVDNEPAAIARIRRLGCADVVLDADVTNPMALYGAVTRATEGRLADVTIDCTDLPRADQGAILITDDNGTVYFYNMATSFTAAALSAEGLGKATRMLIGNGYVDGHVDVALELVRESDVLRGILEAQYLANST